MGVPELDRVRTFRASSQVGTSKRGGRVEVSPNVQWMVLVSIEMALDVIKVNGNPSIRKQQQKPIKQ
jgi:hypothetical protein